MILFLFLKEKNYCFSCPIVTSHLINIFECFGMFFPFYSCTDLKDLSMFHTTDYELNSSTFQGN